MTEKFSKGKVIHKNKDTAEKVAESCNMCGVKYRIRKLKDGYRVDKKY